LWHSVLLKQGEMNEVHERLVETYQLLIADGRHIEHLAVDRIDFCAYGNSQPFRIKIVNTINENHDYFYVKLADASRIYGLELEHMLSPNRINFYYEDATIVEEHVIGVPGDVFIAAPFKHGGEINKVRLSKEFVKFNERCFVRLLGDMRAYNFVVDVIHDLDQVQYRLRSIDFDQQSHEGRARIYMPQFYKENLPFVQLAQEVISRETAEQYRNEERALLRKRFHHAQKQMRDLLAVMAGDHIAPDEHSTALALELEKVHGRRLFKGAIGMGGILKIHLEHLLDQ
ncbi:MAG: hypothetical protein M3R08_07500, partial [Bacteroidota bacterium]|nr:hypothetical protein [Bacteroidota bacterium]